MPSRALVKSGEQSRCPSRHVEEMTPAQVLFSAAPRAVQRSITSSRGPTAQPRVSALCSDCLRLKGASGARKRSPSSPGTAATQIMPLWTQMNRPFLQIPCRPPSTRKEATLHGRPYPTSGRPVGHFGEPRPGNLDLMGRIYAVPGGLRLGRLPTTTAQSQRHRNSLLCYNPLDPPARERGQGCRNGGEWTLCATSQLFGL